VQYSSKIPAAMDKAVYGAKLIVRQDGKIVFERFVSSIMAEEISRQASADGGGSYQLDNFFFLAADKEVEIRLEYPAGQSITGIAKHHLEVRFQGSATFPVGA
jgi:hypothetical protein